jgi:hypothetical protein
VEQMGAVVQKGRKRQKRSWDVCRLPSCSHVSDDTVEAFIVFPN